MKWFLEFLQRMADRISDAHERAQMRDRERFVEASLNPREASQRIHRLEASTAGLQAE